MVRRCVLLHIGSMSHGLCGRILRGNEAYNGADGSSSIYQTNVESQVIVCNKGRKRSEGRRLVEAASRKLMTALASVTPIQGIIDRGTQPIRRAQSRFTCVHYNPVAIRAFGSCNPWVQFWTASGRRAATSARPAIRFRAPPPPVFVFFPHQLLASGQNDMT